jgi:hypothetical protein
MILKDGVLYGYQMLGGLATWYPLTNQSQSYIHTQGLAALEWTVHHELNILYAHFQKLPRYTREQFELGEREHFDIKLNRQLLGVQGAAEALENQHPLRV